MRNWIVRAAENGMELERVLNALDEAGYLVFSIVWKQTAQKSWHGNDPADLCETEGVFIVCAYLAAATA